MTEEKKILPLGQLLIQKKKITDEQLLNALEEQKKTGNRLGHTLLDMGFINNDELIEVLENQFGIPAVKINLKMLNARIVKTIPENTCRKYRLIPILLESNKLTIAATNPYELSFKEEIKFLTNYSIDIVLSPENSVLQAINYIYGKKELNWGQKEREIYQNIVKSKIPAAKILQMILYKAFNINAKEIQLEFFENKFTIIYITPENIITSKSLPDFYYEVISLGLKNQSSLDTEKKSFQEGLFTTEYNGRKFSIRTLIFQNQQGENITLKFP